VENYCILTYFLVDKFLKMIDSRITKLTIIGCKIQQDHNNSEEIFMGLPEDIKVEICLPENDQVTAR